MRSIKLKNDNYLDSTSIVHNKEKLSDVLTTNAMTINLSKNTEVTVSGKYSYVAVPFDNTENSYGDKLVFKNNKIYIGAGVKKVRVSANGMDQGPIGTHIFNLQHNFNILSTGYTYHHVTTNYETIAFSSKIIEVNEGDHFGMNIGGNVTGTYTIAGTTCTYLTVEVVE